MGIFATQVMLVLFITLGFEAYRTRIIRILIFSSSDENIVLNLRL
jgi:hypothetical protein